jgi:hypothetical protein
MSYDGEEATSQAPVLLRSDVIPETLEAIDAMTRQNKGVSIYELAETDPKDAYVYLGSLFKGRFIDIEAEGWGIGSPEEDGQQAFDGLTRYTKEITAPDPDVDEIDVVVAVWKRNGWFDRMRGNKYTVEEALRFRIGPQDLAFA